MLKLQKARTTTGFTIVELLIVIVVIAILAAITIVAFNGIQRRAQNAQYSSAVDAAVKAVRAYEATHGSLEELFMVDGEEAPTTCMQKTADLPAIAGFAEGECMTAGDYGTATFANDTILNRLYGSGDVGYAPTQLATVELSDIKARGLTLGIYRNIDDDILSISLSWYTPGRECGVGRDLLNGLADDIIAELNDIIASGTTAGTDYAQYTIDDLQSMRDRIQAMPGSCMYNFKGDFLVGE